MPGGIISGMTMCIPDTTDWTCAYTDEQLAAMREDPKQLAAMKRSEALAWNTLAALCAWQIGVCPTTVRPCSARCAPPGSWLAAPVGGGQTGALPLRTIGRSFTPHMVGGEWVNSCGCSSPDACSCGPVDEVILLGPVGDIVDVKIGGTVIDPTWYRVDNGNRLVAQHEGLQWPLCQDMSKADGEFIVTYFRGAAPNEMTNYAAGLLAAEFMKACAGDGKCRLSPKVKSVVRNGASYELDWNLFENGWTRIEAVDAVIRIYNPHHLKAPSRVLSPDTPTRQRRTTWMATR